VRALLDLLRGAVGGLPRVYWTLWAGMFVNRLASFVIAFLALFLVRERGFAPEGAGRVVALYGVGLVVAGPLGGALADRAGRRATLLLGLGLGGAGVASLAFLRAPAALAAAAFLAAMAGEMYRPAANAAIADVVPPADRTRAFALVYWAVNLGWTLSLALAGVVAERVGFRVLFLADAATSVAFALIVLRSVPETRPAGIEPGPVIAGMGAVLRDRHFLAFLGLQLVSLVVFVQFQLAAPLDMAAHGVGPAGFSALMALNGLGVVVLQPLTARFVAAADQGRLLAAQSLLIGLGFGVFALAGSVPAYAAGVALWTLGEVLGFPVANALVAELSPADLRGRYQGAFSMTWGTAFAIAPVLGGEVLGRFGGPTLWLGCLATGAAAAVGHLAAARPRRRHLAAARHRALAVAAGGPPPP
jgi:MFS family permease